MKYPDSLLSTDESVVFDVHHHLFVLWKPAALVIAFVAAWLAAVFLVPSGDWRAWIVYLGLAILFILALYMAWRVQVWAHTNLVLTDQRLIYQTGVFTRQSREIPLAKINDVSFMQMVLGRMLGMGDLVVESASESGHFACFNMPDPERLKMQILQ